MDPSVDWKNLYIKWLEEMSTRQASHAKATQYAGQVYANCAATLRARDGNLLEHPESLTTLRHFGPKTVGIIVKKAIKYCIDNKLEFPEAPSSSRKRRKEAEMKTKKRYIPDCRTVTYQVLISIYILSPKHEDKTGISYNQLCKLVNERMLDKPGAVGSKMMRDIRTGLSRLMEKSYIFLHNQRYFLDDDGRSVAECLYRAEGANMSNVVPSPSQETTSVGENSDPTTQFETWEAGNFTIKLLLDTREITSRQNRNGFSEALEALGVPHEVTSLDLGDAIWIAEHKETGRRCVLDFILERKNLGDLIASIHDGRYSEQKSRLKRSCLQHIIYLIEMVGSPVLLAENRKRITTVMSQLVTMDGLYVYQSLSQKDTIEYMSNITLAVTELYSHTPLNVANPKIVEYASHVRAVRASTPGNVGFDYDAFALGLSKSRNSRVGDLFITMLMSVKGISAEKASAIQTIYPTPFFLCKAYEALITEESRRYMIHMATQHNPARLQIRRELSSLIYEAWFKQRV